MKIYQVQTMNEKTLIPARDRFEAYAKFFILVKDGLYPLDKVGGIILVKDPDNNEEYPFRTTPTLYLMKLISHETALLTVASLIGCDHDIPKVFKDACLKDSWVLDKIQELESL